MTNQEHLPSTEQLIPNQAEKISRDQLQAQFEALGQSPETPIVVLQGNTLEIGDTPITTSEDGTEILAILAVPRDEKQDGFLMIGRHPDKGIFIGGPTSKSDELGKSLEDNRNFRFAPLEIGNEVGTKVTIGRAGVVAEGPVVDRPGSFELPKVLTRTLRTEFGDYTSRTQTAVEIRKDKIAITDLSSSQTRVLSRQQNPNTTT